MEYLKKALSGCCKDCCAKRKDSDSGAHIIVPTSQRVRVKQGTTVNRSTFTYLPQPDFYIPLSEDKMVTTRTSPTTRRKQSAPPVMTRTIAIQPISAYTGHEMHKSWGEPQIRIEEDADAGNVNNNSFTQDADWKSTESINSNQSSLSPSHRLVSSTKRLSVAQIAANHSRRSSMSSFDISKDDFDSEMYGNEDVTHDNGSNGKLCFNITYAENLEQLSIHVISAKNLWNPEQSSVVVDSFVKVCILSGLKRKSAKMSTAIQRGTSDPLYDEILKFEHVATASLDHFSVKFSVYAADKHPKRKKLGHVIYKLDRGILCTEEAEKQHLWRHIYSDGTSPVPSEKGCVFLSTCYQPTDGLLKIYVSKGSELAIREHEGKTLEGVYVKIALIGHGKVISKGKTKLVQPASTNPVFDEMITFTLPSYMIDQSCIIISVNAKTSHGKRCHIGYVSLGPPFFSAGSGLEQWTKMLSVPFTMVSKWHSLSVWSKKDSLHNLNECNMF